MHDEVNFNEFRDLETFGNRDHTKSGVLHDICFYVIFAKNN